MHLTSYTKLVRTELHLDAASVQTPPQRSSLFVSQQGTLLTTCSSNHGNISSSRLPLSIISSNMLSCTNVSSSVSALKLKVSSSGTLQLLPPPPSSENNTIRLYQTTTEDATDPSLDIWTVIKPGHVREKIAIFASVGGRTNSAGCSEHTTTSRSSCRDRMLAECMNHAAVSGLSRPTKAKGSREENCSAKRRRRSGNNQTLQRTQVLGTQQHTLKSSSCRSDSSQQPGGGQCGGKAEDEHKVSVVEMVAFLEQRVSEQQPDCKPLQKSSTTITLSRAPLADVRNGSEVRGEEPESIRVSEMVARLESECLRRRTEGDLSRSNSLRRTVGRVLLAAGERSSAPSQPTSLLSSVMSSITSPSLPGARAPTPQHEAVSCSGPARTDTPALTVMAPLSTHSGELVVEHQEAGSLWANSAVSASETVAPPPLSKNVEPLPGLLFLSPPSADTPPHAASTPPSIDLEPRPPRHRTPYDRVRAPSQPRLLVVRSSLDSSSQSERRKRWADRGPEEFVGVNHCSAAVPLGRPVSQDFLEKRQRLQQLLEPQPYLAVLPHHLLVKIFSLLPTQSLAALKCTCHYFKFVIENYGVRPADSLWVSDPRYCDDPCKQCKKRYGRGDVSLCRWHHKPYCQALPYGPGYWMCCHGAHRDAPGCNVGLHDNRWVPVFHSINMPIYRRSHDDDG